MHKLTIKGSMLLIHAVACFVQDWQKENDEENVEGYEVVKDNFTDAAPATPATTPTAPATEKPKRRTKAEIAAEKAALEEQQKAEAATQEIVPGWLSDPAVQAATDPFTTQSAQAATNPFGPPAVAAPAIAPTPAPTPEPAANLWPGQPAAMFPVLDQLNNLMGLMVNDPAKRALLANYFAHLGYAGKALADIPANLHNDALGIFQKIYSGEIQ